MKKTISIFIIVLTGFFESFSQDCNAPITLCSGVTEVADSAQFSGAFSGTCFSSLNTLFYEFTTNNNSGNPSAFLPYDVDANIAVLNCVDAGLTLEVTAGIYLPVTLGDACGALTEVAPCVTDSLDFSINSGTLQPNTTYVLVVGIDPATAGFACDLDITLNGAPLEIDACCDANIPLGGSAQLQVYGATPDFGVENYIWDNVDSLDDFQSQAPVASPLFTTTYTVEGDVGTCEVTDELTVVVQQAVNVKNAITPNSDGFNDTWQISGIQNFDSALINVYDRWGQLVYKSIGYNQPWDGTNEGKRLSAGTYYYVIELNSLIVESEPITGYVVIVH
ncbi:MAG: gliding motility-associated C-terminal domain-containing protein [Saprospiraceae bacterium]